MAFPVSPTNGQQSTIANIVYEYASATNSWTVVPGNANTIVATGNITASYFFGDGSQLTGLGGGTVLSSGTTNLGIPVSNGNANVTINGTSNVVVWATTGEYVTGVVSATGNITGSYIIGNGSQLTGLPAGYANSDVAAYLASGTNTSNIVITGNVTGGNLKTSGVTISSTGVSATTVTATGNVAGGNLTTGGAISATGNITGGGYVGTVYTNSIINTGANGTGNIGSSSLYFNTVFAKATSAQYADLAEMYQGDQTYMPGTVVEFGGTHEVTITTVESSTRIAGVVSTNPSYIMNSGLSGLNSVPVALTGRVPCQVLGPVRKGDRLVSSMIPGVAQALDESTYRPGCMIGKSLDDWTESSVKLIEVVVGRL